MLLFYNSIREDWKPVLTVNSIVYGLQYLFLVSIIVHFRYLIFRILVGGIVVEMNYLVHNL